MFNFTKVFITFLAISSCATLNAAEYWVSKKGNDTNNCASLSSTCLTIQRGLNLLKPGDILNIDEGTYIEDSTNSTITSKCGLLDENYGSLCIKASGTPDKPITVRAQPGKEGKVIIDSDGKRAGLIISKFDYIHVRNLTFINSWTGGIATPGGPSSIPTEEILSIGCVIEGNTILNTTGAYGVNNSAIYMWSTKDWIVRNNIVHSVFGNGTNSNGIQSYGTVNALIENNTISAVDHGINWKDHYVTDLTSKGHVQESIIRNNRFSVTAVGIRISIRGDGSNPAGHNLIEGNIIEMNNEAAVGIGAYLAGANAMSGDFEIKNNLFVGKATRHKAVDADGINSVKIVGNVFSGIDTTVSLRLQNLERPAKLIESNYNVYDGVIQIQNDKYSGDEETYKTLVAWQQAKPSADPTIISLKVDNPDKYSIQRSDTRILAKAIADANANYKDFIPTLTGPNGTTYQPGPYQKPNQIIGSSKELTSGPIAPQNAVSKEL